MYGKNLKIDHYTIWNRRKRVSLTMTATQFVIA